MTSSRTDLHPQRSRPSPGQLAAVAAGVLAGLLVWWIGLPDDPVWDTTWAALRRLR